jgi:hypothetical protein
MRTTLDTCPGCGEPAHASETNDAGYHPGCAPVSLSREEFETIQLDSPLELLYGQEWLCTFLECLL